MRLGLQDFFLQAEDGIRVDLVTGVQTCALPISVATAEVAKAAPDGYTMLLAFNGPLSITPLLSKVPYDVQKDLAPVIITSSQPNVLAVTSQIGRASCRERV